jgi:hypothetical protein
MTQRTNYKTNHVGKTFVRIPVFVLKVSYVFKSLKALSLSNLLKSGSVILLLITGTYKYTIKKHSTISTIVPVVQIQTIKNRQTVLKIFIQLLENWMNSEARKSMDSSNSLITEWRQHLVAQMVAN